MSLIAARKKRTTLYLSVAGLMVMVAAVSAISARDADGVAVRIGMIMVTVGAALWLPWRQLVPAVLLTWLVPNLGRSVVDEAFTFPNVNMALELAGLAGIAFFTTTARLGLKNLEQENVLLGSASGDLAGLNTATGIFDENQLRPTLESELARSRRFGRTFSLVLIGIDEMRQKFDYRDEMTHRLSLDATARLLRETRHNVDRVFHYRNGGFAIILPESTEKDIPGLVKRLRRLARSMKPAEGEPGGPMPVHFGATFFPECATTVDDLLRRAEVALRIASSSTTRYQLDSAEAPELPPAESMRREIVEEVDAPVAEMQPPPPLTNPVAAAIVDEAYAERARQATASDAAPALDSAAPVEEEAGVEPLAAQAPIEPLTAQAAEESSAAVEAEAGFEAGAPEEAPVVEPVANEEQAAPAAETLPEPIWRPYEVATPVAMSAEDGEGLFEHVHEAAKEAAAEPVAIEAQTPQPEPVGASTGAGTSTGAVALAQPVQAAAEVADDFEALLKQMDETLKLIKAVRGSAA